MECGRPKYKSLLGLCSTCMAFARQPTDANLQDMSYRFYIGILGRISHFPSAMKEAIKYG